LYTIHHNHDGLSLFIVILTKVSKVKSLHFSNQQLSASGDDDLQHITTLQYCLADDCTIKMIDTGEKLNIAYTMLIVTIPTDGRISVIIAKQEKELPCTISNGKAINYHFILSCVAFNPNSSNQ